MKRKMKLFALLTSIVSSLAFGQEIITNSVGTPSNGTTVSSVVYNTTNTASWVFNRGVSTATPCAQSTSPLLVTPGGGDSLFNTGLANWSYPDTVSITKLTFKLCYSLEGFVYEKLVVKPVYRNKATGYTYEGPVILSVSGPTGPWASIYYTSSPSASSSVEWTLSSTGAPNISSLDVSMGNIEIGVRIDRAVWYGMMSYPDTSAIKIFGGDIRASFTATAAPLMLSSGTPTISYTAYMGSPWASNVVNVSAGVSPVPSSGKGIHLEFKCANGSWYSAPTQPFTWGTPRPATRSWNINQLNAMCPTGAKLFQNGTVQFRAWPSNGVGNPYGYATNSNVINLF